VTGLHKANNLITHNT